MKALNVDVDELLTLWDREDDRKTEFYLDLETGRPLTLATKVSQAVDTDDVEVLNHLSPALRAQISLATDVLARNPSRYAPIPHLSPTDNLNLRKAFADAAPDPEARRALTGALVGRGAFRHFAETLAQQPEAAQAWADYRRAALEEQVLAWLGEQGVEPAGGAK